MSDISSRPIVTFYRVRMMLAQMVMVVLATAFMLFLPLQISAGGLTLIYGAMIWGERHLGVTSPISIALLFASLAIFASQTLFGMEEYALYVSPFFFGVLFAVSAILLLARRPATLFYGGAQGVIELHWRTSSVWVVVYALGLGLGLVLPYYPEGYWLMPLLPLAGVGITLWLQFVDMGAAWRRPRSFNQGNYRLEQLPSTREGLRGFYEHFIREAMPSIRQGSRQEHDAYEDLVALKMESDAGSWSRILFFAAYADGEMIGTISCMLKTSSGTLGFETGHSNPLSLTKLQKYGKVIEVGRFSIAPKHRFGQDVIQGLMRCAIEYAFETDAAFLVAQSYLSAFPIYQKIGFQKVDDRVSHQLGLGVAIYPVFFNLARRVTCESPAGVTNRLSSVLSPYRAERYFKRQSLRSLFVRKPAWALSDREIAQLILSAPSSAPSLSESQVYVA